MQKGEMMARLDIDFPDDFFQELDGMFDEAAPKMIDKALPIYKDAMEDSLSKSISTAPEDVKRQTGDLIKSVITKEAERTKTDAYIGVVTFEGSSKKTTYKRRGKAEPFRNFQKALGLEYGTSRGQTARPFLQRATNSCEKEVIDVMQEVFNKEVER